MFWISILTHVLRSHSYVWKIGSILSNPNGMIHKILLVNGQRLCEETFNPIVKETRKQYSYTPLLSPTMADNTTDVKKRTSRKKLVANINQPSADSPTQSSILSPALSSTQNSGAYPPSNYTSTTLTKRPQSAGIPSSRDRKQSPSSYNSALYYPSSEDECNDEAETAYEDEDILLIHKHNPKRLNLHSAKSTSSSKSAKKKIQGQVNLANEIPIDSGLEVVEDESSVRDLRQYHYDSKLYQPQLASTSGRKSIQVATTNNAESSDDDYGRSTSPSAGRKSKGCLKKHEHLHKEVLVKEGAGKISKKISGSDVDGNYSTGYSIGHKSGRKLVLDSSSINISSSSSGGSLIVTRESSSMTPSDAGNKNVGAVTTPAVSDEDESKLASAYSTSQLVYVTEQLEGIQKTQDSILNQLRNDMDLLQLENTKLIRENEALRARTYQMNGIIDDLSIDLDRVKTQLIAYTSPNKHSNLNEEPEGIERKRSSSSTSLEEVMKKYGISYGNHSQVGEESSANAAMLHVDQPKEFKLSESTPSKPERKPGQVQDKIHSKDKASAASTSWKNKQETHKKSHRGSSLSRGIKSEQAAPETRGHKSDKRRVVGESSRKSSRVEDSSSSNLLAKNSNSSSPCIPEDNVTDHESGRKHNKKSSNKLSQVRKSMKLTKNDGKKLRNGIFECFGFRKKKASKRGKRSEAVPVSESNSNSSMAKSEDPYKAETENDNEPHRNGSDVVKMVKEKKKKRLDVTAESESRDDD